MPRFGAFEFPRHSLFARIQQSLQQTQYRIALLLAVVAALLLLPIPRAGREFHAIADLGHAPLFGLLAVFLYKWGRTWLPRRDWLAGILVWGFVSGMGLVAEFLQRLIGRHASWDDATANMLGAAGFLIWVIVIPGRGLLIRFVAMLVGAACLVIAWWKPTIMLADSLIQRREMPRIASFENRLEFSRWQWSNCRIGQSSEWKTEGQFSMGVEFLPAKYSSVLLYWPVADWSPYESLRFDIFLNGPAPLDIVVKIEDEAHNDNVNDRFNGRVRLKPGENRILISLWDVAAAPHGRTLDLRRISKLQFFTVGLKQPRRLYLDNIRLVP